jgi:hypothetical protein
MRLVSYNVEWFDALFSDTGTLLEDEGWSARHNVTRGQQIAALGHVFQALDADAVLVVEAPDTGTRRSTARALTHFAERFDLRAREVITGFTNDTQQEIALMYDPAHLRARHDPKATERAPRFDTALQIDLDVDARKDRVVFSKPPLELALDSLATGRQMRLIGAHLKSKAPHGARTRDEVKRLSIANRRNQLAQAVWLRRRISDHLAAGDDILVMGDLNDGPGLDEYEGLFGRSSVEIILGQGDQALFDPHACQALLRPLEPHPASARFYIAPDDRYLQALLDYIMVTPALRQAQARWRIWHPFDDHRCFADDALREALLVASDHFPVVLDADL